MLRSAPSLLEDINWFHASASPRHRQQCGVEKTLLLTLLTAHSEIALAPTEVAHVLSELYELLEGYAPAWYTREHRDKVVAAIRLANAMPDA